MKKMYFVAISIVLMCMMACGNATDTVASANDSTVVDTVSVDTTIVDTVSVDTACVE